MPEPKVQPAPTILVVEDRKEVQSALLRVCRDNGFAVHGAADGDTALKLAMELTPALIVLDVGLPRRNGFEVAKLLRSRGFASPILMLTARDTIADRVKGLDAGADDYLVKPFDYDELLARVRALLRRSGSRTSAPTLAVSDVILDPVTREVRRGQRSVALTQREFELLLFLMRNPGRTISRETLSVHVWKQEFDPSTNVVDVYVNYLRKKIDLEGERPLVRTVRGQGYALLDDA